MSSIVRLLALLVVAGIMAAPASAAPPRSYTCTNIMGANPFRLTIADDLAYTAASDQQSRVQIAGQGQLELAEIGSYYNVLSGPLLDGLNVDVIHIMSPRLTPSGSGGLFNCTKAK